MRNCSIIDCGAGKTADQPQLSLYGFPKNEDLCRKWVGIIGRENINNKHKEWYVCSHHFEERFINRTLSAPRLIEGALPTLLLKKRTPKAWPKIESHDVEIQHNIKLCRACLRTDCKLFSIQSNKLVQIFTRLTRTTFKSTDRLPQELCVECISHLKNMRKFQIKVRKSRRVLNIILKKSGVISSQAVLQIGKASGGLSVKHFGPDHCDASFDEDIVVKIESDYDYPNDNGNEEGLIDIIIPPNNAMAIGYDNDVEEKKFTPLNETESVFLKTVENEKSFVYVKTEKNEEAIEDVETFRHAKLSEYSENIEDEESIEHESTVKCVEMMENDETMDQFDQDQDFESEISNDSNIEKHQESSTENSFDKLKYGKKRAKERKKSNSNSAGAIETDPTVIVNEYFTVKMLSTEEQIACMEKRKTNRKVFNCPFKCEFCFKGFAVDSKYKLHMANHSEERGSFVCGVCKYRFKSNEKLRTHLTGSHQRLFACKKCDYQTHNKGTASNHARLHKGKRFECETCKTKYRTKQTYLSHMRLSHPSGHVCALCACTFVNELGLKMHKRLKHALDNRPIPDDGPVCDVCNVKFVSQDVLATHMWTSHKSAGSRATRLDMIVNKTLGVRGDMVRPNKPRPKRVLKLKPPPPCSECGKQLPSPQALFAHLRRLHPNCAALVEKIARRSFLCDLCGAAFSISTQLKEHRVRHTLGRFPCDQCDQDYESVMGLLDHKKSVHQGVTYPCSICNMTFSHYTNRKRHEKYVHRTTKTEACDVCGKTFKCLGSKMSHELHIHYNKPWPVRKRDRANERKRQRHAKSVKVEETGESQANSSEHGLSEAKQSIRERKRQSDEEDGTDEELSE